MIAAQHRERRVKYYPRHVGDFIRDTVGLTLAERGAYTALLDQYYASEKPIPLDARERYRMAGAISKAERAAVDYIVSRYFKELADGWHQKRCDVEIAAYQERSASASASAQARWSKRNANAMRTHSDGNANQEPITNNHKKTRSKTTPPPPAGSLVSQELWDKFREMRQRLRAPLTPYAETLLCKELALIAAAGGDPTATVEQSIKRGWKGFFPVRTGEQEAKKSGRAAVNEAIWGERKGNDDAIDGTAERVN